MSIKKYYTIGEVARLLNVELYQLRAIDKKVGKKLLKIKNRRYYTSQNIELIKSLLPSIKNRNILHSTIVTTEVHNTLTTGIQLTLPFSDKTQRSTDTPSLHVDAKVTELTTQISDLNLPSKEFLDNIDKLIIKFKSIKSTLQHYIVL
jgi:hypothetical protein